MAPRRIVMLGSAFDVRGGVSAMARVCAGHGLFERRDVLYLATHCDGTKREKLAQALRSWLAFTGMLLARRVALLHVHLNSDASFWRKALFIVPARLLGVPYVLQVHCGNFPAFYRERCGPAAQRFVRSILRKARRVAALSGDARETLAAIAPGVAVDVVPNPVTVPAWQAPLDAGAPTVLFLGALKEAKGVFDLLRAWPAVLRAVPDARLVLGGAGELDRVRDFAREQAIAASVVTPGWVLDEHKEALLREAWVLVLPSHWEALPMAVLEAMAAGVPVVATGVGGIPEALGVATTGRLVPPGDVHRLASALIEILTNQELRRAMGTAARARARAAYAADVVLPKIEGLWTAPPSAERTSPRHPTSAGEVKRQPHPRPIPRNPHSPERVK